MILYIFNNFFPDDSGFSKRCEKEITLLSRVDDIHIICRKGKEQPSSYPVNGKDIPLSFFDPKIVLLETPPKYMAGWYELYRTIQLYIALSMVIVKTLRRYQQDTIIFYVVNSPLTLSLFCWLFSKLYDITDTVLEFHDLEPEMAMHIKKLSSRNIIVSIEYLLEKFLCRQYAKIVVTNEMQKERILHRTAISSDKIFILPNTLAAAAKKTVLKAHSKNHQKQCVVGYISTLSFSYTFSGLLTFFRQYARIIKNSVDLQFIIVGAGDGASYLETYIQRYALEKYITLTGKRNDIEELMEKIDVAIIPWDEDGFTSSIIPTKLFEYFAYQKPVIAPSFGAFSSYIHHNDTGLLYTSWEDLWSQILTLKEDVSIRKKIAAAGYQRFLEAYALPRYAQHYVHFITV